MTSKTLFYKLMREDLKRKIWLAALSVLMFFFALPVSCLIRLENSMARLAQHRTNMPDIMLYFREMLTTSDGFLFSVTVILAVIAAVQGFSYLFAKDKTDLYHSVPVTRTQLFFPNYVNGLLLYLVPYLLCLAASILIGAVYKVCTPQTVLDALAYAAANLLGYMLLYTTALIAVMMTGHIVVCIMAVTMFYLYFPIADLILNYLFRNNFNTFFQSAMTSSIGIHSISPLAFYLDFFSKDIYRFALHAAVMAAAAAVLTVIALLLYRKRPSEAAGKAMAFSKSKPVVKVLLMVPAALFTGIFFTSLTAGGSDGWFLFGALIGLLLFHSIIEIIYDFNFKSAVRHPLTLAISAGLTALVLIVFKFDLFGYNRYLPDPETVESIGIATYDLDGDMNYYTINKNGTPEFSDLYRYRLSHMRLACSDTLMELARYGISLSGDPAKYTQEDTDELSPEQTAEMEEAQKNIGELVYCFNLKNGKKKYRSYRMDYKEKADMLNEIYMDPEYKKGVFPILSMTNEEIPTIYLKKPLNLENSNWSVLQGEEKDAILDSYREELSNFDIYGLIEEIPVYSIEVAVSGYDAAKNADIDFIQKTAYYIYPSFTKTIALLKQAGYPVGERPDPSLVAEITVKNYDYWENAPTTSQLMASREDRTAVYTSPEEIAKIIPTLYQSSYYGGSRFHPIENLDVIVTYKLEDQTGYITASYVFPVGKVPGFVKEDVGFEQPEGSSS